VIRFRTEIQSATFPSQGERIEAGNGENGKKFTWEVLGKNYTEGAESAEAAESEEVEKNGIMTKGQIPNAEE
jgi:hypothetical protein